MDFLSEMASTMQEKGAQKFADGNGKYAHWKVSRDDLLQWIGVWMYMLAFPQAGSRRAYFQEPIGGFGPRHRVAEYLKHGKNGENKGLLWFEMMHACFCLPEYPGSASDPFRLTRKWWDSLRDSFHAAVICSWLMVLDESMIRWMGVGMPGLMVILRKPTPIGLELHTLCCALCGILGERILLRMVPRFEAHDAHELHALYSVWFEVYEGKTAMEKKEFNDCYPKSIALTLRMVKPFFSSGRVLVADSWFGSVACALALFKHGLFAIMNVKTATKNYPKEELLAEVDEIKGKSEAQRAARRARRGKQAAFVRRFQVGSRQVTLTAGGHNKKVPLLLIASAKSMLPGGDHTKTWQVNKADGTVEYHSIRTKQPQMHELYRKWMNIVDVHNKLRQGVISMADIWQTKSWQERHFAEGLGMWEVNIYKALLYFYPKWQTLAHGEFRARLAWALLTLGNQPYPADVPVDEAQEVTRPNSGTVGIPSLPDSTHIYRRQPSCHRCAYCGTPAYWKCVSCEGVGLGVMTVCGAKSKRGHQCMQAHARGDRPKHATSYLSPGGLQSMREMLNRKRARRNSVAAASGSSSADHGVDAAASNSST